MVIGATVQTTNTASNVRTTAKTNDHGDYILPFLVPGEYEVVVEMKGFRQFARSVTVGTDWQFDLTINATLEVGSASESVKVDGGSRIPWTSPARRGMWWTARPSTELPNKDGNVVLLSMLAPGVNEHDPQRVVAARSTSV